MRIVGVLLAAGSSTRFGRNKLHHPIAKGQTLAQLSGHNLAQALTDCIAVVPRGDSRLAGDLQALGYAMVNQPRPEDGMGSSLALAIAASVEADGWIVALADMPWIHPSSIRLVHRQLLTGASIAAAFFKGQRGHPVGFSAYWQERLIALSGDIGARQILADNMGRIVPVDVDDPGVLRDIDHPADLC